jgi:predicted transcriptional regulator
VSFGSAAPDWFKRLARPVRARAGEHPALLPLLLPASTPSIEQPRIDERTALVIEGFPRSGNSFASAAFGLATEWAVPRASNTHLAGQVRLAVRRGVPTLVVIRRAGDAVASLCVAAGYLQPAAGLREWLRFYRAIAPVTSGFVLATFDEVTADFGAVLDRVNVRFGTDFPPFVHDGETAAAVFASLEDYGRRKHGIVPEQSIARPSSDRQARNAAVRATMADARCARLVTAADALYDRLVSARTG